MKTALYLPPYPNKLWALARQMGLSHAVSKLPEGRDEKPRWDFMTLLHMKERFGDAGLVLEVLEPAPRGPMEEIKSGTKHRDRAIEEVCDLLANMGAVGIPVLCYNFMARFGWLRTSTTVPTRGGAMVTAYDHALVEAAPQAGSALSEGQMWDNYAYFLERVVPVAEEKGVKLALHPDDPPASPIRGVARIFRTVDALESAVDLVKSPNNGVTLCGGTVSAMGADVPAAIRRLGGRGAIRFAHFRDVRGGPKSFVETFHDDGQTDMLECMKAYKDIGFDGPMRPDHVPTLEGENNESPGYETLGRLFAIGYMKGLFEAADGGGRDG